MSKYTPLVKDMQKDLKKKGFKISLEQTYQKLVKANFIDVDGNPTKWTIENGYVCVEYSYPQGMQASQEQQDQADVLEVLNRLPQSAVHYNDVPDLSKIETKPLKKAIKSALNDDALSAAGRKKWKNVLKDIESR
ncbi:hypothetical protein [Lactobacillus crispatus]|uniref:hypothetical protein n=1 Tax=Lactobacillus crispatus TaxID=47770 RepID=UPI0018AAF854|nr:hypothetical protein [Lactobacillus crispatus]